MNLNSLNYVGLIKQARAIAETSGFSIQFVPIEQDGHSYHGGADQTEKLTAVTSKDTIYLSEPNPQWSQGMWDQWWGTFYHELGHHDPRCDDCFEVYNEKGEDDPEKVNMGGNLLSFTHNLWEDERSERITHKDYLHKELVYQRQHPRRAKILAESLAKQDLPNASHEYLSVITQVAADMIGRSESWQGAMGEVVDDFVDLLPDKYKLLLQRMIDEGYVQEIIDGKDTAWDTLDFSRRVLDNIFEIPPEKSNPPPSPSGGSGGEGEGEGQASKGKGLSEAEKEALEEFLENERHDHKYHEEGLSQHQITKMVNSGAHIDYEDYKPEDFNEYHMIPPENLILIDIKQDRVCNMLDGRSLGSVENMMGTVNASFLRTVNRKTSGAFVQAVRRYLQIETRKRYKFNQKKGRIHGKSLFKAGLPEEAFDGRVFKNKKTSVAKDSAVTLLVDCSGSMSGSKFELACTTAYKMAYVLHVLQIPSEVLGFTTTHGKSGVAAPYGEQLHIIFKDFGAVYSEREIKAGFSRASNILHANADADAIAWAHSRLLNRKEKMRALIVLSDGSPAGGQGDIFAATKDVVKKIEESSPIHLVAIGIEDNNVRRIYKDQCVIHDAEALESTVLKLVKDLVLKG